MKKVLLFLNVFVIVGKLGRPIKAQENPSLFRDLILLDYQGGTMQVVWFPNREKPHGALRRIEYHDGRLIWEHVIATDYRERYLKECKNYFETHLFFRSPQKEKPIARQLFEEWWEWFRQTWLQLQPTHQGRRYQAIVRIFPVGDGEIHKVRFEFIVAFVTFRNGEIDTSLQGEIVSRLELVGTIKDILPEHIFDGQVY